MKYKRSGFALHDRNFVRHLGICNRIYVKLLQLKCAVMDHNSMKKNEISISITD